MTTVSELKDRMGKVELTGTISRLDAPRSFDKFGKAGRVANAKVKDDTGEVTLTLWNEQCDQVQIGDKVAIHNGWVSEYRGELQLSTGKFGSLEVVGKGGHNHGPVGPATVKIEPKPAPRLPSKQVDDESDGGFSDGFEETVSDDEE